MVLFVLCINLLMSSFTRSTIYAENDDITKTMGMIDNSGHLVKIFSDDRVVTGVNNRIDSYFEIGKNKRNASGSYLEMTFGHSSVITPELSHMTILIDDVPIHSVLLDETNANRTKLRIDLSHVSLEPGFHKISFLIHMNSIWMVCANPDSPSNWLVIYKDSHISLILEDMTSHVNLNLYPTPFYEIGNSTMQKTLIVVPNEPVHAELHAASTITQFFAKQNSVERIPFVIYTESELTPDLLSSRHVIWVGLMDRWHDSGQLVIANFFRDNATLPSRNAGFIGLFESPWNEQRTHLIVTGDEVELLNGAQILSDQGLFSQLRGTHSLLSSQPLSRDSRSTMHTGHEVQVTFNQIGYSNLIMENTLTGHSRVYYHLPSNWDFAEGVNIHLQYTHSTSMNLNESIMAVKVNGVTMGSRHLDDSKKGNGSIEIEIPPDMLRNQRTLEIEIYVEFIKLGKLTNQNLDDCSDISLIGNWLVIHPTSTIAFTPVEREQLDLQSIPFPFVVEGQWDDTIVVIANPLNKDLLSTLMTWIGFMGKDTYNNSRLRFVRLNEIDPDSDLHEHNIIFIGDANHVPTALFESAQSMIRFQDGLVQSQQLGIEILGELQQQSAVIHLLPSPLEEKYALLQLVMTPGGKVDMITRALIDPAENIKLNGQFVVVDHEYVVHSFPLLHSQQLTESIDGIQVKRFSLLVWFFIVLFIFIIIMLLLFIRKMLRS